MTGNRALGLARALAFFVPSAMIAGAWAFQLAGYPPCEMCHWQRWPHYAAILAGAGAYLLTNARARIPLIALSALLIATSGAIGVFHAGVEYGWWQGITGCTSSVPTGGDFLAEIMKAPIIRCDTAPWSLFGISIAGWNAILSLGAAVAIGILLRKGRRA